MKNISWVLIPLLFGMCTRQKELNYLPEVMNKPTSKKTITLNSDQKGDWSLYFGVQDTSIRMELL